MRHIISSTALIAVFAAMTLPVQATAPIDEQDEVIVVTGMRVTQGGAQDINYFRGAVNSGDIPLPDVFTSEGLLSQHDLVLPAANTCGQSLCLNAQAMALPAGNLLGADYFMGLAFDTNINPKTWRRAPLNLVAVIDKSGSMSGEPLDHARKALLNAIGEMGEGDQLSIVLYGDTVETYLPPTKVTRASKAELRRAVKAVRSRGATYMEAGLERGFDLAQQTQAGFDGTTRLMLFTDERPNVGRTDAESFMGMARAASAHDIGMSTIGVGVEFGAELATKVSSVRGGNLFFVRGEEDIDRLFAKEFDFMISEIARDMTVTIAPEAGYKISGVYGVPQDMFTWEGDSLTMSVATAFLSSSGGGLFAGLTRDNPDLPAPIPSRNAPFASAQLRYTDSADKGIKSQNLTTQVAPAPSENLQKAALLSQQYVALRDATTAHHESNDQSKAYHILAGYSQTLDASPLTGLDEERKLVQTLTQTLGYKSGNIEGGMAMPAHIRLQKKWKIRGVEGSADLRRGDVLDFSKEQNLTIYRKSRSLTESDETEYVMVNNEQVYLQDSALTLNYKFTKNGDLRLRHPKGQMYIRLSPYEDKAQ